MQAQDDEEDSDLMEQLYQKYGLEEDEDIDEAEMDMIMKEADRLKDAKIKKK